MSLDPTKRAARKAGRVITGALGAAAISLTLLAASSAQAGSVVIRDFVLTHGIYEREPVGNTDVFSTGDERGYAFARINNDGDATQVSFVWEFDDQVHATIDMNVGSSPGWRTWSSVNLRPGNWRVKLIDQNGVIMAERSFTVGGGS